MTRHGIRYSGRSLIPNLAALECGVYVCACVCVQCRVCGIRLGHEAWARGYEAWVQVLGSIPEVQLPRN